VVKSPQVLQQAHHHLNHDTAERSGSQQNIDSYIYLYQGFQSSTPEYIALITILRGSITSSFGVDFSVRSERYAGPRVTPCSTVNLASVANIHDTQGTLTLSSTKNNARRVEILESHP
jgi:hypothetical protein